MRCVETMGIVDQVEVEIMTGVVIAIVINSAHENISLLCTIFES